MPVAIDTSILISGEKLGDLASVLARHPGPYCVPAHAAEEFLVGIHPPVRDDLRERARRLYESEIKSMVRPFEESDAAQLARPGRDHGWPDMVKDVATLADWFDEHLRGLKPAGTAGS